MRTKYIFSLLFMIFYLTVFSQNKAISEALFLESLMMRDTLFYNKYFSEGNAYDIQIIYTRIDRYSKNKPHFKTFSYQEDASGYFYPASTVKLPIAALSLEKINLIKKKGLNKYTIMLNDSAYSGQTKMLKDSTTLNGYPTVADHIKKMLLYSDNNGFNRLYEFLGTDYINGRLKDLGYLNVNIKHRLSVPLTLKQNSFANPVTFITENKDTIYHKPLTENKIPSEEKPLFKGIGYYENGELVNYPKNFSTNNKLPLKQQHLFLRNLIFPKYSEVNSKLKLKKSDYQFLYKYMSMLPRQSNYSGAISSLPDSYVKFFIFGNSENKIPDNIKIFNKIGVAYGYIIDNSYIIDTENNIEFLLSAVINVNENQIYNDDLYSYEKDGFPFFEKLGKIIYDYELNRNRPIKPDFKGLLKGL